MRAARKYARKRPNQYARLFMILISIKRYRHLRARAGRNILVVVVALAAHAALRACRTFWPGDAHAASELTRARDGATATSPGLARARLARCPGPRPGGDRPGQMTGDIVRTIGETTWAAVHATIDGGRLRARPIRDERWPASDRLWT
jgi:hypothetical protein